MEKGIYPRPRGACRELMRAARAMTQRGVQVKETPKTAGELLLFITAVTVRDKFRPAGWEKVFVTALQHELPYVREMAVEALPLPPPKAAAALLPELLCDSDADVQIAACAVAGKLKDPMLRKGVLAALRWAKERWHLHAASNAALALSLHGDRVRILAARLDDEAVAVHCLQELVSVLTGTNGWGSPSQVDAATGRASKKAWQRFLDRHGKEVAEGKKFKVKDPAVPVAELFPGYKFD
jgi:hypothetical protein